MHRRPALLLLLLLAGMVPPAAAHAQSAERTLQLRATNGVERRGAIFIQHTRNCGPTDLPQVQIAAPSHGSTAIRPGSAKFGNSISAISQCDGVVLPGAEVFYTAAPGYHGEDRFGIDVSYNSGGHVHETVVVTVR